MPDAPTSTSSVHFVFADALRTVAILLVVLSHIVMVVPFMSPLEPYRLAMGSWGVSAFFVLSGFLLSRPYIDALLGGLRLPDWRRYARRRFLRIWPAYAAVVLFAFGKSALHHGANAHVVPDTITHLLMIHNFFPGFVAGADNIALWTMAVDAQFYAVLPIIAWILSRLPFSAERRDIVLVVGTIIFISVAWRIFIPFLVPNSGNFVLAVQRNLIGMGTSFAIGVYIAYFSARRYTCRPAVARLLIFAAIAVTFADFTTAAFVPETVLHKEFILDLLGTFAVGMLVLGLPRVAWAPLDVVFTSRYVAVVAANAYALYLLHVPIKQTVDSFLVGHDILAGSSKYGLFFCVAFFACCAISVPLLHRFVELPFLTVKERARESTIANG